MADFYVDADSGSDSNGGTGWGDAKEHLAAAIDDLITGTITEETIIHLKSGTTNDYTEDVEINGVNCLGKDSALIIQPEVWNETNYENADGDPFNASPSTGDFDIKADKPVTLALKIRVNNSTGIEFRGLGFKTDTTAAGLDISGNCEAKVLYTKVDGAGAHVISVYGARTVVENCYFVDNSYALLAAYKASLAFLGNNYIEDAIYHAIYAVGDSLLVFAPWELNPLDYYTTEIKTTTPRLRKYSAIKAIVNSTICVQDESIIPNAGSVGHVHIRNDHTVLRSQYFSVALESGSLLSGGDNFTFTTLDAKGDPVNMPQGQTIVIVDDSNASVIY